MVINGYLDNFKFPDSQIVFDSKQHSYTELHQAGVEVLVGPLIHWDGVVSVES